MNIEKIKDAKTKIIGKEIEYFEEIDSTHLEAKRVAENEKNGKILIAGVQKAGIGTKGRKWYTGKRKKYCNDNYIEAKL